MVPRPVTIGCLLIDTLTRDLSWISHTTCRRQLGTSSCIPNPCETASVWIRVSGIVKFERPKRCIQRPFQLKPTPPIAKSTNDSSSSSLSPLDFLRSGLRMGS